MTKPRARSIPDQKDVGIWIRVSTEDQAQGESPEHHEKRARQYAEMKGWRAKELYNLSGVSGKSVMGHPETKRMLRDVERGHISGLIFSKLARLARNTRELLDFSDIFRDHSADLVSLQEAIDTTSPAGRLFYTMIAAMAQWEREEIAERVAVSIPVRAKLGKNLGGAATYGYQWQDNQLMPDPEEAPVRKLIYELFLKHRRKKTVARLLNDQGYRTRKGAKFSDTTIDRLLRDPTAKGLRRANYTQSDGDKKSWTLKPKEDWVYLEVEPIISPETWDQCNAILDEQRAKRKPPARKSVHLFAGLTFCTCGGKMYVPSNNPKYICQKCRNKVPTEDLEAVFQDQLKHLSLSPSEVTDYLREGDQTIAEKENLLAVLRKEHRRLEREMDKVYDLYIADQLTKDGFGKKYRPMEERLAQIEDELPRLQAELDVLRIHYLSSDEILAGIKELHKQWGSLDAEGKRQIVEAITEQIDVGKDEIAITFCYLPSTETKGSSLPNGGTGGNKATNQHHRVAMLPKLRIRLNSAIPGSIKVYAPGLPGALHKKRDELGLFQKDVAQMLEVGEWTYLKWERGIATPRIEMYPRIFEFLGHDPFPVPDDLPGRIKAARRRLGLSHRAFSVAFGFDPSCVWRWENGKSTPSLLSRRKLERVISERSKFRPMRDGPS